MRGFLIVGGILVGLWLLAALVLLVIGRRTIARELVTFLPNLIRLFRGLLGDARVPRSSKLLLFLGAIWLASPIDLLPEFLPGVGALDDAIVAGLVLRHVVKRAGPDIVKEHWRGDPKTIGLMLRAARVSGSAP
ncbi:MAG: YkvA family protein [Actinomycetota bacterium]